MANIYLNRLRAIILSHRGPKPAVRRVGQSLSHVRNRLAGFELLNQQARRESMFKATVGKAVRNRGYGLNPSVNRIK